ncbi:7046_t:CDS:2 [Cetraspora pellucida]|uniref:7046_t:CDS:1 n=1 Tax=Cetraspora pellucida TaxID=1433469 RepID=A0A9N9BYJ7_9GLOM|nr:7046_t:CDS:2 [Cetraspora pellucida]
MPTNFKCTECEQDIARVGWCPSCEGANYRENFNKWTSGDRKIDEIIRRSQSNPIVSDQVLEWIDYQELDVYGLIGEGGFGKVYSAEWHKGPRDLYNIEINKWIRRGPTEVALKILNDLTKAEDFFVELEAIMKINAPLFIAKTFGISKDPKLNKYVIVMKMYSLGDLKNFLSKRKNMRFIERAALVGWLAAGLLKIHENGLIHRDLHSRNVLIVLMDDPNFQGPKNLGLIADFGLCKADDRKSVEVRGVKKYVAPEVREGSPYTKESDIYSYGKLVQDVFENNSSHLIDVLTANCLSREPSNRPDIKMIYIFLKEVVVFYELGPDGYFNLFYRVSDELKSVKQELNKIYHYDYSNMKERLIKSSENLIAAFPMHEGGLLMSCGALSSTLKEVVKAPIERIQPMLDSA